MDTVFHLRLHSHGFVHPGRERLSTQVLKRAWSFIPGSTVHGAVAAALIRLDGLEPDQPLTGRGGFHQLLRLTAAGHIRFLPCLPTDNPLDSAAAYARHAGQLLQTSAQLRTARLQAVPHAPIDRHLGHIHGDQLFGFIMHRPETTYEGFVCAPKAFGDQLLRALRLLPLLPFGGRGKFALLSGELAGQTELEAFRNTLVADLAEATGWVQLLTPLLLQGGETNWLLDDARQSVVGRLRRYRMWQSGLVYDWQSPDKVAWRGDQDAPVYAAPGGAESQAVSGLPEGSRFAFENTEPWRRQVADAFVAGVGHIGWRHLGWGQVVPEWST